MTTLTGTYYNGTIQLDKPLTRKGKVKVIVTLEDEIETGLNISDFSFLETQELLKDCKTSFADEVIEERRSEI
jgi:hypothetical protein